MELLILRSSVRKAFKQNTLACHSNIAYDVGYRQRGGEIMMAIYGDGQMS